MEKEGRKEAQKGMMSCFGGFSRSVGVMCYLESVNGRDGGDGAEGGNAEGGREQRRNKRPHANAS